MSVASQIAMMAPEWRGFTTSGYRRTSELCQVGDAAAGLAAREPSVEEQADRDDQQGGDQHDGSGGVDLGRGEALEAE